MQGCKLLFLNGPVPSSSKRALIFDTKARIMATYLSAEREQTMIDLNSNSIVWRSLCRTICSCNVSRFPVKASEDQQPINNQVIGPPPYVTMQCRSCVFLASVSQSSVFFAENQQKLVAQDQCQRTTSDQILELEHLDGGSTHQWTD